MKLRLVHTLILCACAATFPACSLTPAQKSAAISTVETAVSNIVADYAANGKINEASAIATGLNAVSSLVAQTATSDEAKALVSTAVTEYTGDTSATGQSTAQKIASAVAAGLQSASTVAQKEATVVAAGVAASNTAQAASTSTTAASE
jgi:hypothetical protein